MKKLAIIFFVMVMLLSMTVPAFAATLTIEGSENRTYAGYQLLTLTTSLKADDNCAEGTAHTDACYNYAYSVNAKYRTVLQAVTADMPENAGNVTDDQILEFLAALTSDSNDASGTLRPVADSIYRAIKTAGIEADAEDLDGKANAIDQGYWLIADVSVLDGNEANSLVMVDTHGKNNITIKPKTGLPTVEKKVQDINNSADDNIADNDWQDSADHDIRDTVPFKLTATMPSNIASYESYTMIFHDTMSAGLTLKPDSFVVSMYDSADDTTPKDVTDDFDATTEELDDGCTFEIGCDDVLDIDGVTEDTVFVVYYEATLNENAVIGAAGNPNEVYLEFSNDPYGNGTGETKTDKVIVFTYQVTVNKTDENDNALTGAGFTLYKKNAEGNYVAIGTELKGGAMTTFTWEGLDDGDYKLVESTVPAGYNKMEDIEFTIAAEHSETDDAPVLISLDGGQLGAGDKTTGDVPTFTGTITRDIINRAGTILPETGAEGTMWLIGGGSVLVLMAAVFMITRKKMSVYED